VTEAKGFFLDSAVAVLLSEKKVSKLIDGWKKGKQRANAEGEKREKRALE
jgi:hypothetical protein